MSIDLHIHSSNSDGTDKIEDILNIAIEQQLQAISITDHEFLSEVENTNLIEIIPGVEMSVSWYDLELENPFAGIHLLIYFLKKDTPIYELLSKIRIEKKNRNYEILEKLKKVGVEIERKELDDLETKVPGRPHIANLMKSKSGNGPSSVKVLSRGRWEVLGGMGHGRWKRIMVQPNQEIWR